MAIKIGGIHQSSLIDYPDKICCVIFLSRCDFRCGFCHNPGLVLDTAKEIPQEEFFSFLDKRIGLLDGVCISGGEPLINSEIIEFVKKIKQRGFLVKIDTNGSNPLILEKLIDEKLVDYVAMDIKTSIEDYEKVTKTKVNTENIKKSIELLMKDKVDYEFRTTIMPDHHDEKIVLAIGKMLKGSKRFVLQQFNPKHCMDQAYNSMNPYPESKLEEFKKMLEPFFSEVEIVNT